jgi:outer membrane protein assembly factor BamB
MILAVLISAMVQNPELQKSPADAWTSFRGTPTMTGNSAGAGPEKLELLWKLETKESFEAAVAIEKGIVYAVSMDNVARALKLADGSEIWKVSFEDKDGVKGSPCLTEKLVVYGDEAGTLRALDRANGKTVWSQKVGGPMASSPTVHKDRVLVGSDDSYLYCFALADGKPLWKYQTGDRVNCAPALAGDGVIVAGCDGVVRLISVESGMETKQLELGGNIAATPAVSGDQMVVGTMSNSVVSIDWKTMKVQWTYEDKQSQFPYFASPALTEELAIAAGRDRKLHAIERTTGNKRWTFRAKGKIDSSPVTAGNRAYFGCDDGRFYIVDLTKGEATSTYVCGPRIASSPALAAGKIVVGDVDGTLYCFGTK